MSQTSLAQTDPMPEEEVDRLAQLSVDILEGRTDLAAIAGMTGDELEAVYTLAHGFYTAGKYDDAQDVFRFLCMHRHLDPRFWFGFGATCHMQGDIALAVKAYGMAAMLDPTDPQVSLRAAECFVALGDTKGARIALEGAIMAAGAKSAHAGHAERARMILSTLPAETAA